MKLKIHLIILSHTLVAFLAMLCYSQVMPLSLNVIIIHPLLVCAIYTTLLYCSPHKALPALASGSSILLLLLYSANMIAAHYWNGVISWSFLQTNADVVIAELQKLPIYLMPVPLLMVLLLLRLYKICLPSTPINRQSLSLLGLIPIIVAIFSFSTWKISPDMSMIWQGEPLFEFIKANPRLSTPQTVILPTLSAAQSKKMNEQDRPNIILIHGDALRADRLGSYGNQRDTSPFIDSLIEDEGGIKLPYSMSNCSESICGFSSVTTSNFSFSGDKPNLFEILIDYGYVSNFIGTGDLYHGGLNQYIEPRTHNFLRADLQESYYNHNDRFVLDTLADYPKYTQRPNLFYLRLMSPHPIGMHFKEYEVYQPSSDSLLSMLWGNSNTKTLINDHDNNALQFDAFVKVMFAQLSEKNYLDNAIVVIFGDHGDAIGEHGSYGHYNNLFQEEIHVPIVFWASDNIDMNINTSFFATLMDIPATILHHLKIPVPKTFMGIPLQKELSEKMAYLDNQKKTAGVLYQSPERLFKLFLTKNNLDNAYLFDLISDPDELINLTTQETKITEKLTNAIRQLEKSQHK